MNNQQAINLLKDLEQCLDDYCELNDEGKTAFGMAITALELFGNSKQLPSAQPEQIARDIATIIENEQDMRVLLKNTERTEKHDLVSRRAAIKTAKNVAYYVDEHGSADGWLAMLVNWLEILPPAQPEQRTETHSCDYQRTETHESCTDCPLYDHDRHNCPRFNKVIPRTIEAAKPRWIPCEECEKRCEKWENSKT